MKHIAISIEYAGLTLPVVKNDGGVECVPLKPIAELFGLQWNAQHVKLQEEWKAEFSGPASLISVMQLGRFGRWFASDSTVSPPTCSVSTR